MWLEDDNGIWTEDESCIGGGGLVGAYFTNIFTTSNPFGFVNVHNGVPPIVTVEMDSRLLRPYTAEEVQKVLTQMAPLT